MFFNIALFTFLTIRFILFLFISFKYVFFYLTDDFSRYTPSAYCVQVATPPVLLVLLFQQLNSLITG